MDLKVLRSFVEIAREQSFTAAAEKLSVTQPTLSRQIADLEEELGQKLFERTTRSLELTEKGTSFSAAHRTSSLSSTERSLRQ